MGRLTTHVLDTAQGVPAEGVGISLWRLGDEGEDRELVVSTVTNADGRTDEPLLAGTDFVPGVYELEFAVGAYFTSQHDTETLPFLDLIPVRVGLSETDRHYHVPLLVSPWSYSTYRGS